MPFGFWSFSSILCIFSFFFCTRIETKVFVFFLKKGKLWIYIFCTKFQDVLHICEHGNIYTVNTGERRETCLLVLKISSLKRSSDIYIYIYSKPKVNKQQYWISWFICKQMFWSSSKCSQSSYFLHKSYVCLVHSKLASELFRFHGLLGITSFFCWSIPCSGPPRVLEEF